MPREQARRKTYADSPTLTRRRRRCQSMRAAASGLCRAALKTSDRDPRAQNSVTTQGGMAHTPRKATTLGCLRHGRALRYMMAWARQHAHKRARIEGLNQALTGLALAQWMQRCDHLRAAMRPASCRGMLRDAFRTAPELTFQAHREWTFPPSPCTPLTGWRARGWRG